MPAPWTQAGKTHLSEEMLSRLLAGYLPMPRDTQHRIIILDRKAADPELDHEQ